MNKFLKITALVVTIFSVNTQADNLEFNIVEKVPQGVESRFMFSEPLDTAALVFTNQIATQDQQSNRRGKNNIATLGPAKGITYFQIYAVGSAEYRGWEYPSASQTSTANHGGNPLRIVVV